MADTEADIDLQETAPEDVEKQNDKDKQESQAEENHNPEPEPVSANERGGGSSGGCIPCCMVSGICGLICGTIFIVVGIVFATAVPRAIDEAIDESAALCPGDKLDDSFFNPYEENPYYFEYHPFNVLNIEEILTDPTTKPILQDMGAYTYRQYSVKFDADFVDGDAIKYKSYDKYDYQADLSCDGCDHETDTFVLMDLAYQGVLTRTVGEKNFMLQLIGNILRLKGRSDEEIQAMVANPDLQPLFPKIQQMLNGLNSLHAPSMLDALSYLGKLLLAQTNEEIFQAAGEIIATPFEGIYYSGIFARRTVRDAAFGYPSFLGGLGIGAGFAECRATMVPTPTGEQQPLYDVCKSCEADPSQSFCPSVAEPCAACLDAEVTVQLTNDILCDDVKNRVAAQIGEEAAAQLTAQTCGQCTPEGNYLFCLAAVPGHVATSGFDFFTNEDLVDQVTHNEYIKKTGCENFEEIGEYVVYDGFEERPIWRKGANTVPTAAEIYQFRQANECTNEAVYCAPVQGTDGSSVPPSGVNVRGLQDDTVDSVNLYVSQARYDVTFFREEDTVKVKDLELYRFKTKDSLLDASDETTNNGVGVPVDGVQPLAYSVGFNTFLAAPYFIHGDESLLTNVEMRFPNGDVVTPSSLYSDTSTRTTKPDIEEKYETYIDIEPATGKTFNARKRLMGCYTVSELAPGAGVSISDLNYPTMPTDVIIPVYWAEERATINDEDKDGFQTLEVFTSTFFPVLLVGVIVGLICTLAGCFCITRRR